MLAKFAEALQLLWANLRLFSSIILTVWLPGNLLTNYLVFNVFSEEESLYESLRVAVYIEGFFGPIYTGALIYALSQLKQGQHPGYTGAMAVGLQKWGRLLLARFIASFLIMLGFIALIVPGIVLLVRYALLDSAVVLEGGTTSYSRKRSTWLTDGIRWQIFGAGLLFFVASFLFSGLIYLPLIFLPRFDTIATNVVADCLMDVVFAVIQIVMFLYYWEATQRELEESDAAEPPILTTKTNLVNGP